MPSVKPRTPNTEPTTAQDTARAAKAAERRAAREAAEHAHMLEVAEQYAEQGYRDHPILPGSPTYLKLEAIFAAHHKQVAERARREAQAGQVAA